MSPSLARQPIVILGMFRSGTSCVATCFSKMGVHFGEDNALFPADEFNPGGYFEMKDLMTLNKRILGAFGMQHFKTEEIPTTWRDTPGSEAFLGEIGTVLRNKFAGQPRWGWKEPQTTVVLPLYRQVFEDLKLQPLYILCVRNPLDVSKSQRVHGPLPLIGERVVGLWVHYTLSALRETRGATRMVFVYDQFLLDPAPFLQRAAGLTEGWTPEASELQSAIASVQPALRHNRNGLEGLADWPKIVGDTYALATRCAADPDGFQAGQYDDEVEDLWWQWRQMREMVRSSSLPPGKFFAGRPETPVEMAPTGAWQTIRIPIVGEPGQVIPLDPYQSPCLFWIRKATVSRGGREWPANLRPGRAGMLSPVGELRRLVIWGPEPMHLHLPPDGHADALELEVLIQSNDAALQEVINVLRTNLDYVVQKFTTGGKPTR